MPSWKPVKNKILAIVLGLLTCAGPVAHAQDLVYSSEHIGFNISVNLALGTHFQRAGLNFNFLYVNTHFQANSEVRVYFNFKNLGPKKKYPELVLSQGIVFAYGRAADYYNYFLTSVSNQTGYSHSIAYSYNAYFNKIKTTQQTGIVALQFNSITFITENDLLARPALDRFRTGALLLQYQFEDKLQVAVNCSMWTGQMGKRRTLENSPLRSGCYMDSTGGVYPEMSHGLLSLQVKYNVTYSQNVQASVGVDAEQVRNAVQNKFIHDMPFLPKKWRVKNCHIPMIDTQGHAYLYKEGQQIRQPKVYLNLFSNASVFY
jgi:hypothetical protein